MEASILNLLAGAPVYIVLLYLTIVNRKDYLDTIRGERESFLEVTKEIKGLGGDIRTLCRTQEKHGAILLAAVLHIVPEERGRILRETLRELYPPKEDGPA